MSAESVRRATEAWEAARLAADRSAGACCDCRHFTGSIMDDLGEGYASFHCCHPVVARMQFDPVTGVLKNSETVKPSSARSEHGACGPLGIGFERGWLGWWWRMPGMARFFTVIFGVAGLVVGAIVLGVVTAVSVSS